MVSPTTEGTMNTAKHIQAQIERLTATAESGDDWAEICRLEDELVALITDDEAREECAAHGQFGVGA